jgi:fatty acid desaturase
MDPKKEPIPAALNLTIALAAISTDLCLLWLASHTDAWFVFLAAVIAFAFVNNTVFSLLHEAVHGIFHPNLTVNEWAGRFLAAFFPTGFIFQRLAHLGHHRRNRTEAEMFDYYRPGESLFFKRIQWYGILTGVYWLIPPLSSLAFLLIPNGMIRWLVEHRQSLPLAHQTSAEGMLSGYKNAPLWRIKGEVLMTILVQVAIFYCLDLSLFGWLACYAAFGLNWSSLQYTDHAFSELDTFKGAWNLRVPKLVQYLFLNYHHHRVHHLSPTISWFHLEKHLDDSYRPTFLEIYLQMWRGPRPLPQPQSKP